MNKAVFLDRDGVINRKGGPYYITAKEEFVLNEDVPDALRYFLSKGYLLIVITNQGGIAKGVFTWDDLKAVHTRMTDELELQGITIRDIFICPHHPDISPCECRKPGTLLFREAISKYDIDPALSYMIGDNEIDTIPAEKLGIKGILIPSNASMMEYVVKRGLI